MSIKIIAKLSRSLLAVAALGLFGFGPAYAQEVGPDDMPISDINTIHGPASDALDPDVAYDRFHNVLLTVWSADREDGDYEIYAQRINALNQAKIGSEIRISSGDSLSDAFTPSVIYNRLTREYLIVWSTDVLTPGAFEIHGQRLSYTGALVGAPEFRISTTATDTNLSSDALTPDVDWLSSDPGFLVTWAADDSLVSGEGDFRILGQRLDATTCALDGDVLLISDTTTPDIGDALAPAIAANKANSEFMIVYEQAALDSLGYFPEIFARRLGSSGLVGSPIPVSMMGFDALDSLRGRNPGIVYNEFDNSYLVVWDGEKTTPNDFQIYGQALDADGSQIGLDDFMISSYDEAPGKSVPLPQVRAINPAVSFNKFALTYLVVWEGDATGSYANDTEIFYRHINGDNTNSGSSEAVLSSMGIGYFPSYNANTPAVVFNSDNDLHFVVWAGNFIGDATGHNEIYGQAWSLMVTAIDEPPVIPISAAYDFALLPNTPNPFNPSTRFDYTLPSASRVKLEIYDMAGRLIKRLVDEHMGPGPHSAVWNGRDARGRAASSGTYVGRLTADNLSRTRTLNLVK